MRESFDSSASPNKPAVSDQPLKPTVKAPRKRRRWPIVVGTFVAVVLLFIGIPRVIRALNTISTDDAYVNGYVTFVAPRVSGQVARVLVEDNNRVRKGDVLVELDPKPYQVQVAIKQAAVDTAKANLVVAQASVRGLLGQTRSNRFKLARAIEDVDNQVALIRARVATWEQEKATLKLAEQEFDRAERLLATKVVSAEEYDERREALDVAKAQVTQALENVFQARVALLGCPPNPLRERPWPMCRQISTRRSPRFARRRPICSKAPRSSALYHRPIISRPSKCWMSSTGAILPETWIESMPRSSRALQL